MKATKDHISLETLNLLKECGVNEDTPFTWQEILWEYAENFFGSNLIHYNNITWIQRTRDILSLLQQKKYDEADEYFREHCILINNK